MTSALLLILAQIRVFIPTKLPVLAADRSYQLPPFLSISVHQGQVASGSLATRGDWLRPSEAASEVFVKVDDGNNSVAKHFVLPIFFLSNANHLLNKLDELSYVVETYSVDIVCITESWFDQGGN
mgnify:CR=1 FL=1